MGEHSNYWQKRCRNNGLKIKELNDRISDLKRTVNEMTKTKNKCQKKYYRQEIRLKDMTTKYFKSNKKIMYLKKEIKSHEESYCNKLERDFLAFKQRVELQSKLNQTFIENLNLRKELQSLKDNYLATDLVLRVENNSQHLNEDNQQISKPKELKDNHKESEEKLLNSENEILIIERETQLNLELDEQGSNSIDLETLPTLSNQNVQDTSLARGIKRRRVTDEDLSSSQPTNIQELQSKESVSQKDMSVLKRETKRRKSTEELSSNELIYDNKLKNMKLMRHLYCDEKIQTLESLIKEQNNTIEELSKENNLKDELIKVLTKQFESQLPIELNPICIEFRNSLLNNYKMIINTLISNYKSEGNDLSFHILHKWIDKLWLCFDQSSHLMITKIDSTVIDSIEDIIQTSVDTNAFKSGDSSETYLTIHFPHNSMKKWVRMAVMLLLFNGKSVGNLNFQFITEREARLILKRAHPLRAIDNHISI